LPAPLVPSDSAVWPQILPGGRLLYFGADFKRPENAGVFVTSFAKPSERTRVIGSQTNAVYTPGSGQRHFLLWHRGTALVAQEIELGALKLIGEPRLVADPVGDTAATGRMQVAVSASGVLLYKAETTAVISRLTWLDRSGKPLGNVGAPDAYQNFRISPDGSRVAAGRISDSQGSDVWLLEVERGVVTRFTSNPGVNWFPIWSPNGRTIVFSKTPQHLIRKQASGAGVEEPLTQPGALQNPHDWSRDGRFILYQQVGQDTQNDLWYLPVSPDGKPEGAPKPYLRTRFKEWYGRFYPQPDPRWVAYESDEAGRPEDYVQSFPEPRGAYRISTAGGQYPQRNPNGRELFYASPDSKLMAVDVKITPDSVKPGTPHELFPLPETFPTLQPPFDTSPDGRFLVRVPVQQGPQPLHVIVNWPALLKKRATAP
jgi:hypothetical protein